MLGLPELTNDMSQSGTDISPYDLPFAALPLVNGDLLENQVRTDDPTHYIEPALFVHSFIFK